jgi:hypothetical protein
MQPMRHFFLVAIHQWAALGPYHRLNPRREPTTSLLWLNICVR